MERPKEHSEHQEGLSFNDVLIILQDSLQVTKEDLLRLFSVTIKCKESGQWSIINTADRQVLASKDTGSSYLIGVQTIKQWNKETRTMEDKEIPILIRREHQPKAPTVRDGGLSGHGPDSFEAGPGIHHADK